MAEIAPFSSPGKFYKGNLHTHSTLSDGALSPEQTVSAYRERGYGDNTHFESTRSVYDAHD